MSYTSVRYEKRGHIAWLTLDRPHDNNTIDLQLAYDLCDACSEACEDNEVWVVIVTGSGEVFCSGIDLSELSPLDMHELQRPNLAGLSSRAVAGVTCPVIAAINGDALGAGLEIALSCDIRISAENTRFGFPQTTYGLIPSGGGTQRLPRIVGTGKAMEMLILAEPITAEEAYRIGLVSSVVPKGKTAERAEEVAEKLISRAPIAVRYAKEAVNKGVDMTLEQGLRLEADLSILLQSTRDRAEGIKAFVEMGTASFKGE